MSENLEIVQKIRNWQDIADSLLSVKHRTTSENARCAKGRLNWWLNAEPNYTTKKCLVAHTDKRLDDLCRKLMPNFALAQVFYADNNIGIDWQADAAYANQFAYLLNLGNSRFEIKNTATKQSRSLELTGGEVIKFNCKRPFLHRGFPQDSNRIGIGLWSDEILMSEAKNWQ